MATRSGGHYATNHTHIDDFVESTRLLSPAGWMETRRLPGSAAGPSPDRLVIGSEGILGVISECWLRLQKRPRFRATAGVVFDDWHSGCDAVRAVVQTKLWPANLRILDPVEAGASAGLSGKQALLIIGCESADASQGANIRTAARAFPMRIHSGARKSRLRSPSKCEAAGSHFRSNRSSCSKPCAAPSGFGISSAAINVAACSSASWPGCRLMSRSSVV